MLKGIKKSDKTTPKLNLIPILDAVFIFIFFLLMSAQFLDIFELETKAPAVKTFDEELKKDEKPPLNLTLEIKSNRIYVKTGLEGALVGSIDKQEDYDYIGLHQILKRIKKEHIDELSVIFKPSSRVKFLCSRLYNSALFLTLFMLIAFWIFFLFKKL